MPEKVLSLSTDQVAAFVELARSVYRLTASGRRALDKYLVHMEAIIQAMK